MEKESFSIKVKVAKELFYNEDSMYGVYSFYLADDEDENNDRIELNSFYNFVVNGSCPQLIEGEVRTIEIVESTHPKYGDGYTFVAVEPKKPVTAQEQTAYVQTMVTENQFNEIIKVYPNHKILDLMENDEFDYSNMKGIGEAVYYTIKERLFNNLEIQEALVGLKDLGITYNAVQRLIRHFGGAERLVQQVESNIYALCNVEGFGFKTIDKYAINRGDDPESEHRLEAATHYILKKDADTGHSWMFKMDLEEELVKLLDLNDRLVGDMLSDLLDREDDIYSNDNRVALKSNYHYEKTISKILQKKIEAPVTTSVDNSDKLVDEIEQEVGITYTDEQREAITKAIDNNVLVINGRAGSGKTTVVKGVIGALSSYSYCTAALSGKAAQILDAQGLEAKTIHRMLGFNKETGGFLYDKNNRFPYDIVIIDESSMNSNYLFYSVMIALSDTAKIIMVGDSGQLPPIGTGAVFHDVIASGTVPQQEITTIHRQAQKSGILETANKVRDGYHITEEFDYDTQLVGDLEDMAIIPTDEDTDIKQMVIDICTNYKDKDLYEFQIITGRVDSGELSVKNLNIELQKVFNDVSKPFVNRGGYEYREGDKIIQNGNNYEAQKWDKYTGEQSATRVFNGTMGIIKDIIFDPDSSRQQHEILIDFENVGLVKYTMNDLNQISMAYAITVHKSQGETIENVIFVFDFASYMLLSREFLYTGITRASNGCMLIANSRAIRFAVEKTVGDNRRTFLQEMLLENVD